MFYGIFNYLSLYGKQKTEKLNPLGEHPLVKLKTLWSTRVRSAAAAPSKAASFCLVNVISHEKCIKRCFITVIKIVNPAARWYGC